jgi:tetratricopeptide (TPR) repeat protein
MPQVRKSVEEGARRIATNAVRSNAFPTIVVMGTSTTMRASRTAALLLAAVFPVGAQDATAAAKARAGLEAAAVKGDQRALAQALARRPGDWFDVVLTVVAEPMPPLEPTRALVAALPEPERAGLGGILDALGAGPPAARQAFAAGLGAQAAAARAFGDPRADAKAITDAAAAANERCRAAGHPFLAARGAIAAAMGAFASGLGDHGAGLQAAAETLGSAGDRYGAGIARALRARALADRGDLAGAEAERAGAHAALAAVGALEKGGPVLRAALARIDLSLAGPFFDDARDDAALAACTAARAAFRIADPARDLEAATIEAAIMVDRGEWTKAVEATKAHVGRVPQIKDKRTLASFAVWTAAALRQSGKPDAALDLLRKAVGRAKELGMAPDEESPLRMAMALAYVHGGQAEAAHAALEVVARFADQPALRPLARAAVLNRAILLHHQGRDEEAQKAIERAATIPLGSPTLERVAGAGPGLSIAELLIDKNRPKDALRFVRDAAVVAEELGVRLEEVRSVVSAAAPGASAPIHVRLGAALGSYEATGDWAGFEPVFMTTERRLLDLLAASAQPDAGPRDMAERLEESDRQVRVLKRCAAGSRPPIAEEEVRRIMALRNAVVDEAWSRAPAFAMRRFPRAGSIKRARENYCGPDGAVFGASVTGQGAYAFAFSRDRFVFSAIDTTLRVHDAIAGLAALAKDPRSAPAQWVAASAPLWEHLILKQIPVFEDKQWLVVCPDPSIDVIPVEALVPGDAQSGDWRTLPYLMQRIAVGRLPTTTLAVEPRGRRPTGWVPEPFLAVALAPGEGLAAGIELARAFDPGIRDSAPRTERAVAFRLGSGDPQAAESAPAKRARILVFGHGVKGAAARWQGPAPAVICTIDPPAAPGEPDVVRQWMIRGVRGVVAPAAPMDRKLAEALVAGTLKSFAQDGSNPIEALSIAQRALFAAASKGGASGIAPALYHPAHWTGMQAWLNHP